MSMKAFFKKYFLISQEILIGFLLLPAFNSVLEKIQLGVLFFWIGYTVISLVWWVYTVRKTQRNYLGN